MLLGFVPETTGNETCAERRVGRSRARWRARRRSSFYLTGVAVTPWTITETTMMDAAVDHNSLIPMKSSRRLANAR